MLESGNSSRIEVGSDRARGATLDLVEYVVSDVTSSIVLGEIVVHYVVTRANIVPRHRIATGHSTRDDPSACTKGKISVYGGSRFAQCAYLMYSAGIALTSVIMAVELGTCSATDDGLAKLQHPFN